MIKIDVLQSFGKNNFLKLLLLSLLTALYIDIFSLNHIGVVLSYFVFFALSIGILKDIILSFKWFVIIFLTIPNAPRNILDTYDAILINHSIDYNTISSMPFGGISMIQWLTIFFLLSFFILIIKKRILISARLFHVSFLLFLYPFITTLVYTLLNPTSFLFREVITTMRFPLYILLGCFSLVYIKRVKGWDFLCNYLMDIIFISGLIMCCRVPFFLIMSLYENTPSLDLGVLATLCFAIMFSLISLRNRFVFNVFLVPILFMSILTTSRTHIAMFICCFVLYVILAGVSKKLLLNIMKSVIVMLFLIFIMALLNERLYDFFLWKLKVFSFWEDDYNVSDSGLVRFFEFLNIFDQLKENPWELVMGRGLCGYFTFDSYPLPFNYDLDLKSYSEFELVSGKYYHPHVFVNHLILKYGLVGLFCYLGAIASLFRKSLKYRKYNLDFKYIYLVYFSIYIAIPFVFDLFFRGGYAIIFPFLMYVLHTIKPARSVFPKTIRLKECC